MGPKLKASRAGVNQGAHLWQTRHDRAAKAGIGASCH
jgi:hypothetical protein